MKWKNYNEKSFVESEFESITIKITSQEWKEIRNAYYWESDKYKMKDDKLGHKLKCIRHYIKYGKPLTY